MNRLRPAARSGSAPAAGTPSVEPLTANLHRLHMTVSKQFLDKLEPRRAVRPTRRPARPAEQVVEAALDLLLAHQARRRGAAKRPKKIPAPPTPLTSPPRCAGQSGPATKPVQVAARRRRNLRFDAAPRGRPRRPRGRGGPSTLSNLRILCAVHNALAARQVYGDDDAIASLAEEEGAPGSVPVARNRGWNGVWQGSLGKSTFHAPSSALGAEATSSPSLVFIAPPSRLLARPLLLGVASSELLDLADGLLEVLLDGRRQRARAAANRSYSSSAFATASLVGDLAGVREDLALGEPQEVVELGDPVGHVHRLAVQGLQLGELQVGRDDPVQRLDLLGVEVVLGDGHVGLARARRRPSSSAPCCGLVGVGAGGDDLGGRVAVRRPVHLVLHGLEEELRGLGARVVVDAGGVDVEHLPPEDLLRRADVADAGEQLVEVVAAAGPLEPLVVQGEALDEVLAQPLRRPDAELRAAVGLHAVADGDDDVEVVVLDLGSVFPSAAVVANSATTASRPQLALLEDVLDVPGDDRLVALEQLGHLPERQPDGLAVEADLDAGAAVLGLVEEELRLGTSDVRRIVVTGRPLARKGPASPSTIPSRPDMKPSSGGASCR